MLYNTANILIFCCIINYVWPAAAEDCNEYVCGSVVSKCLLTQSCQCKLPDCHCCKDCLHCMGSLFIECCSCLEMCPPKANQTLKKLTPFSSIGDFEGLPELFNTLTAEDDDAEWTTVRFSSHVGLKQRFGDALNYHVTLKATASSINCTVIYLHNCISSKKCLQYCESMGATSYRWFNDGCCECVGPHCFNYGINESRCSACPDDADEEVVDDNNADYGEEDTNYDYGEEEFNYN